jgi:aerobic-type carbon monoxide dehydrogenase small subunit (CoxS/CutS family)/carbon monoxide dehydrogenase subunit G
MSTLRIVEHTPAEGEVPVTFSVNGAPVSLRVPARLTLADALREKLGLTGTHLGCEHGVCGMCTILVDGDAARACLLFAVQVDGSDLTTVEGLGRPDDLHPLQESFGRHHGLQCGFCTPGFLMSSYDLLSHEPDVDRKDLPEELSGVICRCTGYRNIIDAVDEVATSHRDGLPQPTNCGHRTLVGRGGTGSTAPASEPEEAAAAPELDQPHEITLPSGEPTIAIELASSLESSLSDVGKVFDDVRLLARCLPGAELTDELSEEWYRGRARVALGPIRLSFNSIAHLLVHESDRMHVLAQGSDTSGGRAQAEIQLSAYPDGGGTRLEARARVFLVGRIAGFGRSLAGDVSRRMFEDFATAVDQAARGEVPVAAKAPSAFRLLLDTIRDRRRRARENRRRRRSGK